MVNKADLKCHGCNADIIKSYKTEAKLRAKIIKWNKDGMFAICKSCGIEVPVDENLLRSLQDTFIYEIDDKKNLC